MSNGLFIDGIASSQAIDTAGEVVSIAGMDISSLVGSVFNYEHKSDVPAQIVGKILYAKKIFDQKDCENDRQSNCWNTCKLPFLYVMGQLFDDYSPSAQEIAGIFRYDSDNKDQLPTLGFSIEGSKIAKEGMTVSRSIARKVTITVAPANKTCLAEAVQDDGSGEDSDLASIFKTEYTVDMVKAEEAAQILGIPMNKSEDYKKGSVMGQTTTGKDVYSKGPVHAAGFDEKEHGEAADMHFKAANAAKGDIKLSQHHYDKYKLHSSAVKTAQTKKERFAETPKKVSTAGTAAATPGYGKLFDPQLSGTAVKKAMTADSAMSAPGQKTQGAALGKESLDSKMKKDERGVHTTGTSPSEKGHSPGISRMGRMVREGDTKAAKVDAQNTLHFSKQIKPKALGKSEMLKRAEEAYKNWNKRSDFEKFMKDRMPNLAKGEVVSMGQAIALKKSLEAEKELAALVNYETKPKKQSK